MCAHGEQDVFVARLGDAILFRIVGLANMKISPAVAGLAEQAISSGVFKFAFEMSKVPGTDSTFMGTLVALALTVKERNPNGWICVVNASEKVLQGLENLGAARFLRFKDALPLEEIKMERLNTASYSKAQQLETIRKAHERLIEIDRRNVERFGTFLESLKRELDA